MPIITTKAIVFSSLKYGDSNLIVKCFTADEGIKSYMIRGVLKSKKGKLKPSYFQPLTQLSITASHSNKDTLNYIKEARVINMYETIHTSIVKQTILIFLSEILSSIIQEEEANKTLYEYIETSLIWLDTHKDASNFHLLFLLNLSKFLGFYPDVSDQDKFAFNLIEAKFTDNIFDKKSITGPKLYAFKRLLNTNFDTVSKVTYSKGERQSILNMIIEYFELHLDGFKTPKSLGVLETVFS